MVSSEQEGHGGLFSLRRYGMFLGLFDELPAFVGKTRPVTTHPSLPGKSLLLVELDSEGGSKLCRLRDSASANEVRMFRTVESCLSKESSAIAKRSRIAFST